MIIIKSIKHAYLLLLFCILGLWSNAQISEDFTDEVAMIAERYDSIWDQNREAIVFTGSSSIRLWEGLEDLFPDQQIINTGFGGSQTRDLLKHLEPLVLSYRPKMVFIYEGDNDINYKKSPNKVIRLTRKIIDTIWEKYPDTQIILISAKPSIVRWDLKKRYIKLNRKLKEFSERSPNLAFANVWDVMLKDNVIDESLYIEDGLHMNQKGYALWYDVIKPFLKQIK